MGFEVNTEVMRSHAAKLDEIAASGRQGVEAGRSVAAQGEAFGIICSFIGAALAPVQQTGIAAAAAAADSLTGTAVGIRASAAAYDAADELSHERLSRFLGELGG